MHPETYRMLAAREDTYWWHLSRRGLSVRLLRHCAIQQGSRWLDLGCGTGGNLPLSESFGNSVAVGFDLSPLALSIARDKKPRARLIRGDLNNALPFADGTFDVVTVFNVLYHDWVKSEAKVVAEIARVLRPNGVLLITEPAFAILARQMDIAAMGRRRYRITDVARMCECAGLRIEHASYFTSFGFPLLLAMKFIRRLRRPVQSDRAGQSADMESLGSTINGLLLCAAGLESRAIAARFRMPFGTTLVCLARKT